MTTEPPNGPTPGDHWLEVLLAEWRAERHIKNMEALDTWAGTDRPRLRDAMDAYVSTNSPDGLPDEFERYIEKEGPHVHGSAAPARSSESDTAADRSEPPQPVATEGD